MWSEAVSENWLPRVASHRLVDHARPGQQDRVSPWAVVRGLGAAYVTTAARLGWQEERATEVLTDIGHRLDLTRDPPAMVRSFVRGAVWRWRWKRLASRHTHLRQADGEFGAFIQPIFQLLNGTDATEWGLCQKGALRSAMASRQWPQARLVQAGHVESPNCRLCWAARTLQSR